MDKDPVVGMPMDVNIHNEGETSNPMQLQTVIVKSNAVVNFFTRPSPEDDIHSESEYIDATQLHNPSKVPITDFFNLSDSNNLIHLHTLVNPFTWCNGRRGRLRTEKRLDRAICNLNLLDFCKHVVCHTLPKIKSDHYPLLYSINIEKVTFKSNFKFLSMWTLKEEYARIIEEIWNTKVYGCPMYVLDRKLKLLKAKLKYWNKNQFGNVTLNVRNADHTLKEIQRDIGNNGYTDSFQDKESKAQHDLEIALNLEEAFWKEKSRIKWRNTNLISTLVIEDEVVTNQDRLERHIVNHFQKLFNNDKIMHDSDLPRLVIPKLVNDPINDLLTVTPSINEIHQFFNQGWLLPNFNANTLVLIPKVKEANCLGQYMPIALASFKFKIISKILADRLSTILPNLISPKQKGFVHGRNIREGICLTSEAINILSNKCFSGKEALKIDIAKAFNGKQIGYFTCTNGVRQGEPLSPILFCIAEDVLSRGITNLVNTNSVNLIKANKHTLVPSHTLFADDIMIFCRGGAKSLQAIADLIKDY
ncbi:uncharacterized protein LOC131657895 [Vicia villosa]|uniref:uncharacterized protein LOC131657895 n=1 Tax=Vicia villosa TaxID=3911 RepID=UPI00273ADCBC|nr:uncharacterized protein LOC131657895 [Vicia villosa]